VTTVTVPGDQAARADRLAAVMTRDRVATGAEDIEWSAEEVLGVALSRGLAELERLYLAEES
jgi:hypothetical protein